MHYHYIDQGWMRTFHYMLLFFFFKMIATDYV